MHDEHLLEKMLDLKASMVFVAARLCERGDENHGEELRGAAVMLATWIDGIRDMRSNV